MRVSFCVHYVTCLQIITRMYRLIVLTCNKYQIRSAKLRVDDQNVENFMGGTRPLQ